MFWLGKLASAPSNVNITKANGHSEANTQRHDIYNDRYSCEENE